MIKKHPRVSKKQLIKFKSKKHNSIKQETKLRKINKMIRNAAKKNREKAERKNAVKQRIAEQGYTLPCSAIYLNPLY